MINLSEDSLRFTFPDVHSDAVCEITFQRTLRIPDDGNAYPLPAGLGQFPVFDVQQFSVGAKWHRHGGVFLPMHSSEAMWMNFSSPNGYPFAIKVATGKVNAVNGESWSETISPDEQDYVVLPKQRWLDGFCVEKGVVRQFVATALGDGQTVEEQLTGEAEWGGLQLVVYPMRAEEYRMRIELPRELRDELSDAKSALERVSSDLDTGFSKVKKSLGELDLNVTRSLIARFGSLPGWEGLAENLLEVEARCEALKQISDRWEKKFQRSPRDAAPRLLCSTSRPSAPEMGMAAGGKIQQEIARDSYGSHVWDMAYSHRCFVHAMEMASFTKLTGKQPTSLPITPEQYLAAGIPWFEFVLEDQVLGGSKLLADVTPLGVAGNSLDARPILKLSTEIREGCFESSAIHMEEENG